MVTVLIFALIIIVVIALALKTPDAMHIERTIAIEATPEAIFPLINDLHSWASWSPYEKLDTQMKKTYSGSDNGVGAVYEWDGNARAGAGKIEITESVPFSKIVLLLDTYRPMKGRNTVKFTVDAVDDMTMVTWGMDGKSPFITKVAGVFMNMDAFIGKDFEVGLANLKGQFEKDA